MKDEFYRRYDHLLANWYLLTSQVQQQVDSIRRDLHSDLGRWRPHLPEPDWSVYERRLQALARTAALHPYGSPLPRGRGEGVRGEA